MSKSSKQIVTPSASHLDSKEFIIFSELPLEIRLYIWNLAIPQGRILLFRVKILQVVKNSGQTSFSHRLPAPKILHVCREARNEAIKSFRRESNGTRTSGGIYDGDWWNPSRDTIYIPSSLPPKGNVTSRGNPGYRSFSIVADIDPQEIVWLRNAHHLAWSFKSMWLAWASVRRDTQQWIWNDMARWLLGFPNLKTFTWVVDGHGNQGNSNPIWLKYPEVPVYGVGNRKPDSDLTITPSKINANLQKAFEIIKSENPEWNYPEVRFVFDASIF
ncbi:hypothetical protein SBOR_8419 [Sclerotinia borealis F-4128]|uniref:2EXR domain-containing protein n=1 Tax=Sclerotinia borealis (strain F-4128) TaxID=1432307 RepID=W9C5N4_SCLBF|nr:hypothetical protein SBOR_8419 [Sclerotinia borealis F-4128]